MRVTARNAQGSATETSSQTAVVQQGTARSVPVSSVPNDERLIVSSIRFSPNPVTSRNQVITAVVTIKDTRGLLIRDAQVFMRATPRVTTGDLKVTGDDGVATMQLTPNQRMRIQRGFNVQFFIKAFRQGDPVLARRGRLSPRPGPDVERLAPPVVDRRAGPSGPALLRVSLP